jgi:hypothetical protein
MTHPFDAWALGRLICGHLLNGELQGVSRVFRGVAEHLAGLRPEDRNTAFQGFLASREDRDEIIKAIANAVPDGPAPEAEPMDRPATLSDLRTTVDESQWHWKGYIPAAQIAGIAAYEGIGKTRFAMDLARRIWLQMPWPDGQPATLPARTPTLWVCSDGQQDELLLIARSFGLPDEALCFNTAPQDPYGGTELDSDEDRERLERYINLVHPGLVFVDTLTNATSFDLCRATENKRMMAPIRDIAKRTRTTIVRSCTCPERARPSAAGSRASPGPSSSSKVPTLINRAGSSSGSPRHSIKSHRPSA